MSYHNIKIPKTHHNSHFKIQEEVMEYLDAISSGNKIMAIQELSDVYGCLEKLTHSLGYSISDLKVMSDTTKRVFNSGARVNESLFTYLYNNHKSISEFGLGFIQIKTSADVNYNFYTEELDKFDNYLTPHSHQNDFISEVLCGELYERVYELKNGNSFAHCACGDASQKLTNIDLDFVGNYRYFKGDIYQRLIEDFHTVEALNNTVTRVVKLPYCKGNGYVLGEATDTPPINNNKDLWGIVESICLENSL